MGLALGLGEGMQHEWLRKLFYSLALYRVEGTRNFILVTEEKQDRKKTSPSYPEFIH